MTRTKDFPRPYREPADLTEPVSERVDFHLTKREFRRLEKMRVRGGFRSVAALMQDHARGLSKYA